MMGTARKGHHCPVLPGLLPACAMGSDAFTAEAEQGLSWLFCLLAVSVGSGGERHAASVLLSAEC